MSPQSTDFCEPGAFMGKNNLGNVTKSSVPVHRGAAIVQLRGLVAMVGVIACRAETEVVGTSPSTRY